ncbi:MAG: O-antigen ligase family protein [Planctomycetota bacterium]
MNPPNESEQRGDLRSKLVAITFFIAFAVLHFICTIPNFMPRLFESVVSTKAVVVVVVAWLFVLLLVISYGVKAFHLAFRSTLIAPMLAILGTSWISSMMGDHSFLGPYELTQELAWGVWILMAFHLWRAKDSLVWIGGLVLGTLLVTLTCNMAHVAGLAMGRLRGGKELLSLDAMKHMLLMAGFDYPFYNCNFNAAFLMAPVVGVLLAWRFRVCRNSLWLVAVLFGVLAIAVGMVLSKASMLVLSLGGLALWLGPKWVSRIPRRKFGWYSTLTVLAGLVLVGWILNRFSHDEDFMLDSSSGARMEMWQGVVALVSPEGPRMKPTRLYPCTGPRWGDGVDKMRRLLLGWGPGAYPAVSAVARPTSYYAGSYTSDYSEHPHSSLMSFLFDGGLLGLAAGLWLFLRLFFLLGRLGRVPGVPGAVARVLLGVSLCMAAYSLVSVEGHYSEVRVWWAVVIGGTMALELAHRKLEPRAPKEFALGFTLVFLAVALGVMGRFILVVAPRTLYLSDVKKAYGALLSPEELEGALLRVERSCLLPEGRTFMCMNAIMGLKDAALLRENEVGRIQALMADRDPTLSGRWRMAALIDLHEAVRMTPDFSDLARLFGEVLWKISEESQRIGQQQLPFGGPDMNPEKGQVLAESWLHRAIIKGDQDALIFDTLRRMPTLNERLGQRILDHPIFNDTFRRRAPSKNIRLPLRFNYAFFLLQKAHHAGAINEALAVVPSLLRDMPQDQAWILCQGLGEALLSRRVDPMLWKILERGGPTPPQERERNMSQPARSSWFLEVLRDRLFTGEPTAGWLESLPPDIRSNAKVMEFKRLLDGGPPR